MANSKPRNRRITELTPDEALDFFMSDEQFHNFELPEYFDFTEVLNHVRKTIGKRTYDECCGTTRAAELDNVNFDILLNKDGQYAVRPLILCNPYLYYFLAREICTNSNWKALQEHFAKCQMEHISNNALPIVVDKETKENFYRSATILNWWNTMEQRAIELSLDYRYMFVTDITNCYGSVNPETIDWALARKDTDIATDDNHALAQNIITLLSEMQHGRNIGIPQGSVLFDFTGEIVLAYADLLLDREIATLGITDSYEVLRYRDEYRIFCNSRGALEKISYALQRVLERLNFRMNSAKTFISSSIITDSIKPDKLFAIYNTPINSHDGGFGFDNLEHHLLYILQFARQYPNSGRVRVMLSEYDKRIADKIGTMPKADATPKPTNVIDIDSLMSPEDIPAEWLDPDVIPMEPEEVISLMEFCNRAAANEHAGSETDDANGDPAIGQHRIGPKAKALCAICAQIAVENINCAHYALRIASRIISDMPTWKKANETRMDIIAKIRQRLIDLPNSTYCKLWLQNMTYTYDKKKKESPYSDVRLCQLVMGEKAQLWDNSWLQARYTRKFPQESVVDDNILARVTPIITFREIHNYLEAFLPSSDNDA